jgi:hypothetical protein
MRSSVINMILVPVLLWSSSASAFHYVQQPVASRLKRPQSRLHLSPANNEEISQNFDRRRGFIFTLGITSVSALVFPNAARAEGKSFAPGGTLVDYDVGVTVGNPEASKSRKPDNSNVIFNQDYYFKFGTAARWIKDGDTDFPKAMPFSPSQQRYDTNKKYRERVQRGVDLIAVLNQSIKKGEYSSILPGSDERYSIRPMGLMANGRHPCSTILTPSW